MKIWLRLVYADGDVAATLLRPWKWSYAFVALLYPFYIESEIRISIYYDQGASTALLLRSYCALAVSVTIRVILSKILNRSGIAVQCNGGFSYELDLVPLACEDGTYKLKVVCYAVSTHVQLFSGAKTIHFGPSLISMYASNEVRVKTAYLHWFV